MPKSYRYSKWDGLAMLAIVAAAAWASFHIISAAHGHAYAPEKPEVCRNQFGHRIECR